MLPAQPNKSIIEGISCLQAVSSATEPVGVRALARTLGMEPTRVNRLLKTLSHIGLVQQNDTKQYTPGPGLHILAAQSLQGSGLLNAAFPSIRELFKQGLTVAVGVLWQDQVCYVYHGHPDKPLEDGISGRHLYPAAVSGIGLAVCTQLGTSPALPENYLDYTADPAEKIRKQGFARVLQPNGITTIGTTISAPAAAGIALAGTIAEQRIDELAALLKQEAAAIAARL